MELQEIRGLIRQCLEIKIKEISGKKPDVDSFSQFKETFAFSLERSGVSRVIVDEILLNESDFLFETVYSAWKNIELEMLLASKAERKIAWNDAAPHYIRIAVSEVLSGSSYEHSLEEISNEVVSRMTL